MKRLHISRNSVKVAGYKVYYGDIRQLTLLFREIFVEENYKCMLPESPYIIDGGANIGLAVLYFKKCFPDARIVAFEPSPESFACLKKNVEINNLENVEIYNAALGGEDGHLTFYTSSDMPKADIGASTIREHVDHYHAEKGKIIEVKVPCKKITPFINKTVDLLKLDVEGSEGVVIKDINGKFSMIDNSIMEYHGQYEHTENSLSDILKTMEDNNHFPYLAPIGKFKEIKKKQGYIIKSKKMV